MKEALAQLGVQSINEGTSTGINNFLTDKKVIRQLTVNVLQ
jgi:hypothetical protein